MYLTWKLISSLRLIGNRVSNMYLAWLSVSILCSIGQGYLLCASQERGVYCVVPGTQGI